MAAILGTAAKGILAKLGGKAVKAIGGAIGLVKKNPGKIVSAATTAATVGAVGTSVVRSRTGGAPPPPQLPGGGTGAIPPGMGGGGMVPYTGGGQLPGIPMPITLPPQFESRPVTQKGYVTINMGTPDNPQYVQVLAKVAYALGLRKRPRKTTRISSRDIDGAQRVNRFITRFSVGRTPKTKLRKKGRK